MENYKVVTETLHIDFTPYALARMSDGLFNASEKYKSDMKVLNYFLLCASLELGMKSALLSIDNSIEEKGRMKNFGHNIDRLNIEFQDRLKISIFNQEDTSVISKISPFYKDKGLEYITGDVIFALVNGLKSFPDISQIERTASKLNQFLISKNFFN